MQSTSVPWERFASSKTEVTAPTDSRGPDQLIGNGLGSLSCWMQRHGFDLPLGRIFPVQGIFPWSCHGF